MKPVFVLTALLAAGASVAHAQKPASSVGIAVGYGRDRILSNNQYSSVSHSAYQAGLTADAYVSNAFSFHPEVLYTMRYFDTSNDADLNRDITSIDVPLLARYHAGGLYLEAGPEVDVPLKAVNEAGDNVKSDVNNVALNYIAGVGYHFGHGPSLGVRYDGGASNVFKSNPATVLGAGKFKSSAVFVVLGYSFGG
jgi:hypothetical protein